MRHHRVQFVNELTPLSSISHNTNQIRQTSNSPMRRISERNSQNKNFERGYSADHKNSCLDIEPRILYNENEVKRQLEIMDKMAKTEMAKTGSPRKSILKMGNLKEPS